jgi:hypothetical protein
MVGDHLGHAVHRGEAVAGREIDAGSPFLGTHLLADGFDDSDRRGVHWRGHGVFPLELVISRTGRIDTAFRILVTSAAPQGGCRRHHCNAAIVNVLSRPAQTARPCCTAKDRSSQILHARPILGPPLVLKSRSTASFETGAGFMKIVTHQVAIGDFDGPHPFFGPDGKLL